MSLILSFFSPSVSASHPSLLPAPKPWRTAHTGGHGQRQGEAGANWDARLVGAASILIPCWWAGLLLVLLLLISGGGGERGRGSRVFGEEGARAALAPKGK